MHNALASAITSGILPVLMHEARESTARVLIVHNGVAGTLYVATKFGPVRAIKRRFICGPLQSLRNYAVNLRGTLQGAAVYEMEGQG